MAITFDRINQYIVIESPQTQVTVQALINAIRDYEDNQENMDLAQIALASGKEDLGGGTFVGITLKLINWKIKFQDRPGPDYILCEITGGNLVAVDSLGGFINPVQPSAFTQVVRTSSASATISELEIQNLSRLIESLRRHHKGYGNIWYWDPVDGNDGNSGQEPTKAFLTFTKAHQAASDWNHDIIFCLPSNPTGQTYSQEHITITKNFLFVRGPGKDFVLRPISTTAEGTAASIKGTGVEISGMIISTINAGPSADGVYVSGDFALLEHTFIEYCTRNGVFLQSGSYAEIRNCAIAHNQKNGIQLGDGQFVYEALIDSCLFDDNVENGSAHVGGTDGINYQNNIFLTNGGYGISLGPSAIDTVIDQRNFFARNAMGDILDNGVNTAHGGNMERAADAKAIWEYDSSSVPASGNAFGSLIHRILGISLENYVEDDIVRDGQGNKTSSILYLYDSPVNATTHNKSTGLSAKYDVTASYDISGKMTLFKVIKV